MFLCDTSKIFFPLQVSISDPTLEHALHWAMPSKSPSQGSRQALDNVEFATALAQTINTDK